jgi:hypothetical protein
MVGKSKSRGILTGYGYGCGMKPGILLLVLLAAGLLAGLALRRPGVLRTGQGGDQAELSGENLPSDPGARKVLVLEGQVEYLEGQVRALREENERLLQQLGGIGLPDGAVDQARMVNERDVPADFVGAGLELMKLRENQALPIPVREVPGGVVEERILNWLRRWMPGERALRLARAIQALGWIDEAEDPLPPRAALMMRQLGGWYDDREGTLLMDDHSGGEMDSAGGGRGYREALGIALAQLLRERGPALLAGAEQLTTDERLAREAMLAGDAALTRLLYALGNPGLQDPAEIPSEDPDHPFNHVFMPQFFRDAHFFAFNEGMEFAQGLHGAGGWEQVNGGYRRPPRSTAEILDAGRYLDGGGLAAATIGWDSVKVGESEPFWDDRLGQFLIRGALAAWQEDEIAGLGSAGWAGDRLLAFNAAAGERARGHVVWQTLWRETDWAEAFERAMGACLVRFYAMEESHSRWDSEEGLRFTSGGRHVLLLRNRNGTGVLLIDAGDGAFFERAEEQFVRD